MCINRLGKNAAENAFAASTPFKRFYNGVSVRDQRTRTIRYKATHSRPVNPYGSKGKPDHQEKVKELETKASAEAGEGDYVLREKQIQGVDSRRRPDVQIVDSDDKTRKYSKRNAVRIVSAIENREAESID